MGREARCGQTLAPWIGPREASEARRASDERAEASAAAESRGVAYVDRHQADPDSKREQRACPATLDSSGRHCGHGASGARHPRLLKTHTRCPSAHFLPSAGDGGEDRAAGSSVPPCRTNAARACAEPAAAGLRFEEHFYQQVKLDLVAGEGTRRSHPSPRDPRGHQEGGSQGSGREPP